MLEAGDLPPDRSLCPHLIRDPLRAHQQALAGLVAAMARGEATGVTDILAAVTPGGGKSLLPVIAAARLIEAGKVERICWVVPRDSLRLQAEEAFADPVWRSRARPLSFRSRGRQRAGPQPGPGRVRHHLPGHRGRTGPAPGRTPPPSHPARGGRGASSAHPRRVRAGCAILSGQAPAPSEDASAWSRALLPLLESAALRLLLSGTLERADGRRILWLPYRTGPEAGTQEVDLEAPGWAVIGYSRAQAVAERAVLPVTFGALDGEASWLQAGRTATEDVRLGPHRLSGPYPTETTRPALFTALRTGFARELLQEAFRATRNLRARRRAERGSRCRRDRAGSGQAARGGSRPAQRPTLLRDAAGLDAAPAGRAGGAAGDLG